MHSLFESTPFLLLLVIGSYIIGQFIYRKSKVTLLHPVIISMVLIIIFLGQSNVSYAAFAKGTSIINFMLGPTVVALGVILYEQLDAIKGNMFLCSLPFLWEV